MPDNNQLEKDLLFTKLSTMYQPVSTRLKSRKASYTYLFNNIKDAVTVYQVFDDGNDFVCIDINPAAEKIDNFKKVKVVGRSISSFYPDIHKTGLLDMFRRVWKTGNSESLTLKYYKDQGIYEWREYTAYKLPSGQIVAIYNLEKKQSQTERELRLICQAVEQTREGIGIFDLHGNFSFVNSAFARMHGYEPDDLLGQNYSILCSSEFSFDNLWKRLQNHRFYEKRGEHLRLDSSEFPSFTNFTALKDENSQTIGVVAVVRDLTDQIKIDNEISHEKQKLKSILSSMHNCVTICDLDYRIIYQNNYSFRYSGNIIGKKCFTVAGKDELCEDCPIQKSLSDGMSRYTIRNQVDDEGIVTYWEHFTNPIRNVDGDISSFLIISTDITERKRAERLLVANQQRLRDLASQLSMAEEEQRRQIAENLHDEACQWLALSILKVDILRESIDKSLIKHVDDISKSMHQTISTIRGMVFDLSSPTLYKFGLEAAVFEYITEFSKNHPEVNCEFIADREHTKVNQNMSVLLFRALRELLINTIKYAKADNIQVEMKRDDSHFIVKVSDDGVGFDISKLNSVHREGGFGLFNIIERLDYVGGKLDIQSVPYKGSSFTMKIPLAECQC